VVQRFVACRNGWSRADVLHPCLVPILGKTYGCVVFQEQVVQVIAAVLGCTEAEADGMRKQLAKHERQGTMETAQTAFVRQACHYHPDLGAERAGLIWQQIEGWSGYGFTEGHAASFAITAQRSAYLSQQHPAEYFAALMSNQPMGYYSANSLAAEARRRGVQILPVDVNASEDKCQAEEASHLRLGLRMVEDLRAEDIGAILAARAERPFVSLLDFSARVPLHRDRLENLLLAGAFDRLHPHTRGLLWRLGETVGLAQALREQQGRPEQAVLLMGTAFEYETPCATTLADFTPYEKLQWEWRITGVASSCHPFAYLRESLNRSGILTAYEANHLPPGARATVAGLNLRPHRPPTRSGRSVLFSTVEDETDFVQVICSGEALQICTPVFLLSPVVIVRGVIERKGRGASLAVEKAKAFRPPGPRPETPQVSIV
jgi:error-prone DNA polymerase